MKNFLRFCCISLFALPVFAAPIAGVDVTDAKRVDAYNVTAGRMPVESYYSYVTGVTSDTVVKATPGFLHAVTCGSDAAATAGSLQIRDGAAAGAGNVVFLWTFTTTEVQPRTIFIDAVMATGITLDFATTADVTCTVSYR